MKRRSLGRILILAIFASTLSCTTIRTSSGEAVSKGDPWTPTGRAGARIVGLGPEVRTDIWTDGTSHEERRSFPLHSDTFSRVAQTSNPAIVNIFTTQELSIGIGDPLGIIRVPLGKANIRATSLGTGFFISDDGFMLTNAHVIAKADEIHVFLHDRSEAKTVRVIGLDPLTDLALLKVESPEKLPFLELADSDAVRIGDMVVAIGNPFGLDYSITTGVISAKNRMISPGSRRGLYEDFLQTSAQINPGNSGGPLCNLSGEVVGVNTVVIARSQGIGFAIPSNLIKDLLPTLVRHGRIVRGYAGLGLANMNPSMAARFKAPGGGGALVVSLDSRGPAAKAGLLRGDVILKINGRSVKGARSAARLIGSAGVGGRLALLVSRDGRQRTLTIVTVRRKN